MTNRNHDHDHDHDHDGPVAGFKVKIKDSSLYISGGTPCSLCGEQGHDYNPCRWQNTAPIEIFGTRDDPSTWYFGPTTKSYLWVYDGLLRGNDTTGSHTGKWALEEVEKECYRLRYELATNTYCYLSYRAADHFMPFTLTRSEATIIVFE